MSPKIILPIEYSVNADKQTREVIVSIDAMVVEDFYNKGQEKVPNRCRVSVGQITYNVLVSRVDLEKHLESIGIKISKLKSI